MPFITIIYNYTFHFITRYKKQSFSPNLVPHEVFTLKRHTIMFNKICHNKKYFTNKYKKIYVYNNVFITLVCYLNTFWKYNNWKTSSLCTYRNLMYSFAQDNAAWLFMYNYLGVRQNVSQYLLFQKIKILRTKLTDKNCHKDFPPAKKKEDKQLGFDKENCVLSS